MIRPLRRAHARLAWALWWLPLVIAFAMAHRTFS